MNQPPQSTTGTAITPAPTDELLDLLFLRVADLVVDKIEPRLARLEVDAAWIRAALSEEQPLADTRYEILRDATLAATSTRHATAGPLEVLSKHADSCRYAIADELPALIRNAAGALYWNVQRGQLEREVALRHLVDACDGRLAPDVVAAIFLPAVAPAARGRK